MEGYEDYSNDKDVLSKFGRNITTEVKNNKIDPVIGRDDEIRKREILLSINFWEYHSGCPDTYFSCGGKRWYNPEIQYNYESIFYRGIRLYDIQKEICNYLEKRLMKKMI